MKISNCLCILSAAYLALPIGCVNPPSYPIEPHIEYMSLSKDTMRRGIQVDSSFVRLFANDPMSADPDLSHATRATTADPWTFDNDLAALNIATFNQGWPTFDDARQELVFTREMKEADRLRQNARRLKNVGVNSGSDLLLTKSKQLNAQWQNETSRQNGTTESPGLTLIK